MRSGGSWIYNTRPVNNNVTIITIGTLTVGAPVSTTVAHWNADVGRVEVISSRTLGAIVVCQYGASDVSWVDAVAYHAGTVTGDLVAVVAEVTDSHVSVVGLAILIDEAANSVFVKNVSVGTSDAKSIGPGLTAEVIIDQLQEVWILIFRTECRLGCRCVDQTKVDYLSTTQRENDAGE